MIDVGKEHVKKLGYKKVNGEVRLNKELRSRFKIGIDDVCQVNKTKGGDGLAFYDRKNDNYDLAMFLTGAFDVDTVHKACNWIYKNKECFGETILEIGCDIGAMTTFLGSLFPEKKIVSIDRNAKGVEIARRNCEKMGVTNIEFRNCDAKDLHGEKFDTVFTMRVFHENCDIEEPDPASIFDDWTDAYSSGFDAFSSTVSNLIKEDGNLISIERMDRDCVLCGFIDAIGAHGLRPVIETYEDLKCLELGMYEEHFQCMVSRMEPGSELDVCEFYADCFMKYTPVDKAIYSGFEARAMFSFTADELIDGFIARFVDGRIYRFEIRTYSGDKSCIVVYCFNGQSATTVYCHSCDLEKCRSDMEKSILDIGKSGAANIEMVRA
ncbi:SAM-dependent methyltransferase [methanogenic archaeon mixed culture ISO4-G1]|nr:SAM-dependent methyltransferase [methanogenic archaeon mixed culture ISO4-G1]